MKTHTNLVNYKKRYTNRVLMSKYNEVDSLMRYNLLYKMILTVYNENCQLFSVII